MHKSKKEQNVHMAGRWSMNTRARTQCGNTNPDPDPFPHQPYAHSTHTWYTKQLHYIVSRHYFLSSVWKFKVRDTHCTHTHLLLFLKLHWTVKWRLKRSSSTCSTTNGCFVILCVEGTLYSRQPFLKLILDTINLHIKGKKGVQQYFFCTQATSMQQNVLHMCNKGRSSWNSSAQPLRL